MSSRHTPGPWTKRVVTGSCSTRIYGNGTIICELPFTAGRPNAANARLIAAAPRMRKALELVLGHFTNVNAVGEGEMLREVFRALADSGMDQETLNKAATCLLRGAAPFPFDPEDVKSISAKEGGDSVSREVQT